MNLLEEILTIGIAAGGTMLTRFLPFILFPSSKPIPVFIRRLGNFLPPAILGMLVIYCYKDLPANFTLDSLIEIIAGMITVFVHLWKKNMFLSISLGTLSYILLLNFF
ncbi:branched-chain amino acid transport protein AzlD [Liquorilactobacillus sucicola DSM 21376 = JCM 15457]|uniref:Branched-chain amino acid transporter AzlD n=1 Tax=Liquorilactobacillus sucicola DSM 21376 = JCM 15457 TaxID=1423806 RepID=A0A023CV66_9LACO|nr:AzlD domain-containing protein [Liquorilactobacillus sucicola]KRN05696.1 hypothetical protein FD15_GL002261 [Liquorilactobacillus sucicola DSM 21376 = JCM 15457]GAJ25783.1 branched-chain amino acid transport protein AzlD [Liquorilactobacillus sucicola DSM 21376 = JCM 15457]